MGKDTIYMDLVDYIDILLGWKWNKLGISNNATPPVTPPRHARRDHIGKGLHLWMLPGAVGLNLPCDFEERVLNRSSFNRKVHHPWRPDIAPPISRVEIVTQRNWSWITPGLRREKHHLPVPWVWKGFLVVKLQGCSKKTQDQCMLNLTYMHP